jgi:hypothetical protein
MQSQNKFSARRRLGLWLVISSTTQQKRLILLSLILWLGGRDYLKMCFPDEMET